MLIQIELGPEFQSRLAGLGQTAEKLGPAVSAGLNEAVRIGSENVGQKYISGQLLKARTGLLRKAVQGWTEGPFDGVIGVQPGSAVDKYKYLLGDEEVTIKPKNGRLLAIPIAHNLTGSGVAKKQSPRDYPDGWFQEVAGRLMYVKRSGKSERSKLLILFLMVPRVTVNGTDALAKGVLDAKDRMTDAINERVGQVIN